MSATNKLKELLASAKAFFDLPPMPPAADVAPADTTAMTMFSYAVDGGAPVFVDASDDGVANIDPNDMVYIDAAMTAPYADGTYTVTGSGFQFTVAAGMVTTVVDSTNTGPGAPLETPAVAAAAPADVPVIPTVEQRLAALEAKIMEMCKPVTAGLGEVALAAASQKLDKHTATIKSLFEIVEQIAKAPSAAPVTIPDARKEKMDKAASKEARFERIVSALNEMKS